MGRRKLGFFMETLAGGGLLSSSGMRGVPVGESAWETDGSELVYFFITYSCFFSLHCFGV